MIDNQLTPVMKKCNKPIKPKDLNHVVSLAPTSHSAVAWLANFFSASFYKRAKKREGSDLL